MIQKKIILMISIFLFTQTLRTVPQLNFRVVSFEESMSKSYAYNTKSCIGHYWQILRNLYTQNLITNRQISEEPRIPKIVHWIWLGSPLPQKYRILQESWKRYNPDWEFKLWTDTDVKPFNLKNQKAFDKAINWGEKSDIFRYEILYRYGGVYVDIDFECLRSFDILHHLCDFYTGIAYTKNPILYNGLIGASKQHPIIAACVTYVQASGTNHSEMIMSKSGPYFFTRIFFQYAPNLKKYRILPLPVTYLYPLPNNKRNDATWNIHQVKQYLQPESFALHYWGTSWVKK